MLLQTDSWLSSGFQLLSTRVRCLDLELPSCDEAFSKSVNVLLS